MSIEAATSIVFGILQLSIGLVALYQQWQLRRMQGKYNPLVILCFELTVTQSSASKGGGTPFELFRAQDLTGSAMVYVGTATVGE